MLPEGVQSAYINILIKQFYVCECSAPVLHVQQACVLVTDEGALLFNLSLRPSPSALPKKSLTSQC